MPAFAASELLAKSRIQPTLPQTYDGITDGCLPATAPSLQQH